MLLWSRALFSAYVLALSTISAASDVKTVYYQPTPYPPSVIKQCGSIAAKNETPGCGLHILDGWLPSVYYGQTFQMDDRLRVGGWGDYYYSFFQFDLTGLPASVTGAQLAVHSQKWDGASYGPTDYNVVSPDQAWARPDLTTKMTWNTQPSSYTFLESYAAGKYSSWWIIDLTDRYSGWKNKSYSNTGVSAQPLSNNNNWDNWDSSRAAADDKRPTLQISFTPPVTLPDFKMPLPGGLSWLVTTEVGGYDCTGAYDSHHDNTNYFAVDFGWKTKEQRYKVTDKIPIIAAADGTVTFAGRSDANGNYVVIGHGGPPGFETRYLHLKDDSIVVTVGQSVRRGDRLGYMGNTGQMVDGVHLHFGIRYIDANGKSHGDASSMGQYAIVDGWLLKSFQTECTVGGDGELKPNRFYLSSNRSY